jgi:hypothetical protein
MLYEQMLALQQTSDTESVTSDSNCYHSGQKTPTSAIMQRILRVSELFVCIHIILLMDKKSIARLALLLSRTENS